MGQNNKADLFDRPLKIGDEVGGQAWGHTGTVRKMIVKGFTEKKVRVLVTIPGYEYKAYGGVTHVVPPREELTHAYAHELIKTGVNVND